MPLMLVMMMVMLLLLLLVVGLLLLLLLLLLLELLFGIFPTHPFLLLLVACARMNCCSCRVTLFPYPYAFVSLLLASSFQRDPYRRSHS